MVNDYVDVARRALDEKRRVTIGYLEPLESITSGPETDAEAKLRRAAVGAREAATRRGERVLKVYRDPIEVFGVRAFPKSYWKVLRTHECGVDAKSALELYALGAVYDEEDTGPLAVRFWNELRLVVGLPAEDES